MALSASENLRTQTRVHYWLPLTDHQPRARPGLLRRWRDGRSAQAIARELLSVALGLDQLIPMRSLVGTICDAILGKIAVQARRGANLAKSTGNERPDVHHYALLPRTAGMLDWLIRHSPAEARYALTRTIGHLEDHPERYGVTTWESLKVMLHPASPSASPRTAATASLTVRSTLSLLPLSPTTTPSRRPERRPSRSLRPPGPGPGPVLVFRNGASASSGSC